MACFLYLEGEGAENTTWGFVLLLYFRDYGPFHIFLVNDSNPDFESGS